MDDGGSALSLSTARLHTGEVRRTGGPRDPVMVVVVVVPFRPRSDGDRLRRNAQMFAHVAQPKGSFPP